MIPRDVPDEARGDAHVEQREVRQHRLDDAPDVVPGLPERPNKVRGEEEADRQRGGERQPVGRGAEEKSAGTGTFGQAGGLRAGANRTMLPSRAGTRLPG